MSDREQAGFRGPVKSCVEESVFSSQPMMRTTTEYRPDGMLLETRFDHEGGNTRVTARDYDSDGHLIKIKPANSDAPTSEIIYVYDSAGRSLNITNTENGDRTDFEYDDAGRKVGVQRFDPKTLERSRSCAYGVSAWDAAACGAGIPLGGTIMTIYEDDRPVEMQTRDASGQMLSRIIRTYNAAGFLMEEKPIIENPAVMFLDRIPADSEDKPNETQIQALNKGLRTLLSGRSETGTWHTYDAQNRLVTVRECNYIFERTTTIVYNDHDDRAEEHSTIAGNSVWPIGLAFSIGEDGTLIPEKSDVPQPTPFDTPKLSEVRYAYQYDDHGNWTQQTANYGPNSGGRSNVRNRRLTYY